MEVCQKHRKPFGTKTLLNSFLEGQHFEGAYKGMKNLPDDTNTLNLLIDVANKDMGNIVMPKTCQA